MKKKVKKVPNIENLTVGISRARVQEKRPMRLDIIFYIFYLIIVLLIFCFINDERFTVNQMTFLGVFGASVISIFTILVTLNQESRSNYITARKSALMLSEILDSLHSQIKRIENGAVFTIAYPKEWIRYYENCCTYLKYDYLPCLLREFDIVEKLNSCIEATDSSGMKQLLHYRNRSITDWRLDFDIFATTLNLSLFASGGAERPPWVQQPQYKEFKKFIIDNYSGKIKQITIQYLKEHDGHADATAAEYFVMEVLRSEPILKTGTYHYIAAENRAMLDAIFAVYLLLNSEDIFKLCWGELSLNPSKDTI